MALVRQRRNARSAEHDAIIKAKYKRTPKVDADTGLQLPPKKRTSVKRKPATTQALTKLQALALLKRLQGMSDG